MSSTSKLLVLSVAVAMYLPSTVFSQTGPVIAAPEPIAAGQVVTAPVNAPHPVFGVRIKQAADGVAIVGVNPGSIAEQAGIRVGDEVRYVAERQIHTTQELTNEIINAKPGSKVDMFIVRNGEPVITTVAFPGRQPNAQEQQIRGLQQQVNQLSQQLYYQNQAINQMQPGFRIITIPPRDPATYQWWLRVQRGETNNDPAIFQ